MSTSDPRDWQVEPYPKHARVFADFTGSSNMSDEPKTYSATEMARYRAEAEEAGFDQTFDTTVGIYEGLAPSAGGIIGDGLDLRGQKCVGSVCQLGERTGIGCSGDLPCPLEPEPAAYPDGNPKTLMGAQKPDLSVVPPIGILHLATAMMNGANKYGPFNWRDKGISVRPYVTAALRHLLSYLDGEDHSADTIEAGLPVHHLGHVMACCAILLDAESVGQLNDNRPGVPGKTGEAIEDYRKNKRL